MVRPRRRALGVLAGGLALFLVGTNIQAGWIMVMSSLLLGAVVAGLVLPRAMIRGIAVERRAPGPLFAGSPARVDLGVTSKRGIKLSISVEDGSISPARAFVAVLSPEETVWLRTSRPSPRRGVYEGSPVRVSSSGPLGVGLARRVVPAPGRVVVYPRIVQLDGALTPPSARDMARADTSFARRGTGQDYLGIREYHPGDSLRHVHWPSSARTGSLMVREFEQERPRRIAVAIDTSSDAEYTRGEEGPDGARESVLDLCCSVAGSIALAARSAGHDVSLVAAREGGSEFHIGDPASLLEWLAGLEAPGGVELARLLDETAAPFASATDVVIAMPTWPSNGERGLMEAVGRVVGCGASVSVVVVQAGPGAAQVLSAPETTGLLDGLAEAGAAVFLLRWKEDVAECLKGVGAAVG